MPQIYLAANRGHKPESLRLLQHMESWLRRKAQVVGVDRTGNADLSRVRADLLIVFGGDGTMLSVARRLKGNPVPVLGVNLGQMGFLAEVHAGELKGALPRILRGDYVLSTRMMLRARLGGAPHGHGHWWVALNEAVLLRLPGSAMLSLQVKVSGEEVSHYKGDGLIVSTATGSTGYSLSAGGPILSERLKALILVPICAHTLANRPIVLSGEESLEVIAETRTGGDLELVFDGQVPHRLKSGTRVHIEKAPWEFNLVTLGQRGRYEIIRDKLHWAGWVKEAR